MYLQSGWGNWNLLVSFLHQHKQFTRWTQATIFPSYPNQWELRQNQWCFPGFSRSSSYFQHTAPTRAQCCANHFSLDQNTSGRGLWPQLTTAQGQQLIMLDFFSLLEELPKKESSHFLSNCFSHKTVLQNFSPPLKFPFLFQLQKTGGTCLLNSLTSVSSSFQVQLPSSNHLQSPTLNAKLVLVKAETRNNLFLFCSMFTQHLV